MSLPEAIHALYDFLFLFKSKCILTAHNCKFDYPRLMLQIQKVYDEMLVRMRRK